MSMKDYLFLVSGILSLSAQATQVCSSAKTNSGETYFFAFQRGQLTAICVRNDKSPELSNLDICGQEMFVLTNSSNMNGASNQVYQTLSGAQVKVSGRSSNAAEITVGRQLTSQSVSGKRTVVVQAGTYQVTCK
ncbi:MAG: hypothetical protein ACK5Y2_01725 [Bdellovibrionales bacterium]